jgi:hypothetical protein
MRRREEAARGLDGLSYFVLCKLNDEDVNNAEAVCKKVRAAFVELPNWRRSQNELRRRSADSAKRGTYLVVVDQIGPLPIAFDAQHYLTDLAVPTD